MIRDGRGFIMPRLSSTRQEYLSPWSWPNLNVCLCHPDCIGSEYVVFKSGFWTGYHNRAEPHHPLCQSEPSVNRNFRYYRGERGRHCFKGTRKCPSRTVVMRICHVTLENPSKTYHKLNATTPMNFPEDIKGSSTTGCNGQHA